MRSRNRWLLALLAALTVHATVAIAELLNANPLPLSERMSGTPEPTYVHMTVTTPAKKGAPVAKQTVLAPKLRDDGDLLSMTPPHRPRLALWVMDVPVAFAAREGRDAGPE